MKIIKEDVFKKYNIGIKRSCKNSLGGYHYNNQWKDCRHCNKEKKIWLKVDDVEKVNKALSGKFKATWDGDTIVIAERRLDDVTDILIDNDIKYEME